MISRIDVVARAISKIPRADDAEQTDRVGCEERAEHAAVPADEIRECRDRSDERA